MSEKQANISYIGLGKKDGEQVKGALDKALTLMKTTAVKRAMEFSGNTAIIDDYLDGYGKIMGKNRKSEFRAIIEAFGLDPERVTILAETKTYQELYAECVQIRGRKQASRSKSVKVTADQHAAIVEKVALMDEKQSATILQVAANHAVTLGGDWERRVVNQIMGLTLILQKSNDKGYKATADKLHAIVHKLTERLDAAAAKQSAKTAKPAADQGLPAAPAPLANEQAPAEQQKVA